MSAPRLSVTVPTYRRPDDLRAALQSVLAAAPRDTSAIELVVSDNSPDDASEPVAHELLARWGGPTRYLRVPPEAGAIGNFNACVAAASAPWVLILHDDDRLRPGALRAVLAALGRVPPEERVLLFGVHVVDGRGGVLRRQTFPREQRLGPQEALRRVLTHSSFVRAPAIVVHAAAYAQAGPYDAAVGGAADIDMWVRLFAAHGVRCVPATIGDYTVHPGAWTTSMFTPETIAALATIFDRAVAIGLLPEAEVRARQADFMAQFLLGGALRSLRSGDRPRAAAILGLFRHPTVVALGPSRRWAPVRLAFTAATATRASAPATLWLLGIYDPPLAHVLPAYRAAHDPGARLLEWQEPPPPEWERGRRRGRAARAYGRSITLAPAKPGEYPLSVMWVSPRLLWALVRAPEDVVVVVDLNLAALFAVLSKVARRRRVVSLQEGDLTRIGLTGRAKVKVAFRRLVARGLDAVVSNGPAAHAYVADVLGVPPGRIVDGWWLAGLPSPAPRPPQAEAPPRLLYLGQLIRRKGVDRLLAALGELAGEGVELTLTVAGEGPERAALEAQAARLGLAGAVRFLGAVPHADVAGLLARSDLLVLPSLDDLVGRVAVEALSAGVPVIVSRAAGAADALVRDGDNGLVVDPRDPASLTAALRRAADPATCKRLTEGAQAVAPSLSPAAAAATIHRAVDLARRRP